MPNFSDLQQDTIAARATASGRGGVGIIRVSGPDAVYVAQQVLKLKLKPKPRYAYYSSFYDENGTILDEGIGLYFPKPNSFTGQDVIEFHGHGGIIVLDMLLKRILALGIRLAKPGEFSERAFLNNKIDLTQAEAIADLIDSSSEQAARSAIRSLQGKFSQQINTLVDSLINLRIYVESAIDFPEEEINFLNNDKVMSELKCILQQLSLIVHEARQGVILREGMTVVIAGRPNAGKSSLMNVLSGTDTAIVTDIPGTTRDVLKSHINIDGMPLHIIDTAGLRETKDKVEQIGVEMALKAIRESDRVLFMVDGTSTNSNRIDDIWPEFTHSLANKKKLTIVRNKIDLTGEQPGLLEIDGVTVARICACNQLKTESGIDQLKEHLKSSMGFEGAMDGSFTARSRHLESLRQAQQYVHSGLEQFECLGAGELLAEDLRLAQNALGEITGEFTSDDLLGRIFSSFCIGK